jgi:hypothetical protein
VGKKRRWRVRKREGLGNKREKERECKREKEALKSEEEGKEGTRLIIGLLAALV